MPIIYRPGNDLSIDEVLDVYRASTLGERRPVEDWYRMRRMMQNANLVVSAWDGAVMVGIARAVSDYAYCTYLSDLAVRQAHQKTGIGKELVRRVQALAPEAALILLAAPKAADYYPRIGFERHESAWILRPGQAVSE